MNDIEQKALALINAEIDYDPTANDAHEYKALCRAIEQHEAFRQEVSDIVYRALTSIAKVCAADAAGDLSRFIIPKPKPDPLVDVAKMMGYFNTTAEHWVEAVRAALDALGFEIRKKNDD